MGPCIHRPGWENVKMCLCKPKNDSPLYIEISNMISYRPSITTICHNSLQLLDAVAANTINAISSENVLRNKIE